VSFTTSEGVIVVVAVVVVVVVAVLLFMSKFGGFVALESNSTGAAADRGDVTSGSEGFLLKKLFKPAVILQENIHRNRKVRLIKAFLHYTQMQLHRVQL